MLPTQQPCAKVSKHPAQPQSGTTMNTVYLICHGCTSNIQACAWVLGQYAPAFACAFTVREIPDPILKGRVHMNIFEKATGITGSFESGSSLASLLAQAQEIRLKLGKRGYLLDSYLAMFFEAANEVLSFDAGDDGFEVGCKLRSLCVSLIDHSEKEKEQPLHDWVLNTLNENQEILQYQERFTKVNLLYALCFDHYLPIIAEQFLQTTKDSISNVYDSPAHRQLYQGIVEIVGEPIMERLNLNLKQLFLTAPLVSVFVQGLINDLLYCLSSRDKETSRQIFQLLLDERTLES